jgi:hypothetical protein
MVIIRIFKQSRLKVKNPKNEYTSFWTGLTFFTRYIYIYIYAKFVPNLIQDIGLFNGTFLYHKLYHPLWHMGNQVIILNNNQTQSTIIIFYEHEICFKIVILKM